MSEAFEHHYYKSRCPTWDIDQPGCNCNQESLVKCIGWLDQGNRARSMSEIRLRRAELKLHDERERVGRLESEVMEADATLRRQREDIERLHRLALHYQTAIVVLVCVCVFLGMFVWRLWEAAG